MVASPVLDIKMITEVQKCSAIKKKKKTVKKETPNPQHLLPTRLKISAETKLVVNFYLWSKAVTGSHQNLDVLL